MLIVLTLAATLCWPSSQAFPIPIPMRLLRVPKIYNALITSNQKLLPSEAFPASSGPSFQPIGLSGDPVLLNPESLAKSDGEVKPPPPLVFYPRYNVYHQLPQAVLPFQQVYQPPPVVVPVQRSSQSAPEPEQSTPEPQEPAGAEPEVPAQPEEPADLGVPIPEDAPPAPSNLQLPFGFGLGAAPEMPVNLQPPSGSGFVTNNRPENSDIPDVPPPPPPVSTGRRSTETKN